MNFADAMEEGSCPLKFLLHDEAYGPYLGHSEQECTQGVARAIAAPGDPIQT